MELAFEATQKGQSVVCRFVSILLVVELAFEGMAKTTKFTNFRGFNPSCSGIGF